jgi:hypothetical protein
MVSMQLTRQPSGSIRADSAVEPTRSANITVTWRRSALSPIDQVEAQLQSAVLAAAQVSLLNSAQARQISIFTCVTLAVFCLAPRRPIKALFVASTGSARDISHLGVIFKTIFRRGQTSTKD